MEIDLLPLLSAPWNPSALTDAQLNALWDRLLVLCKDRFGQVLKVEGLLLMIGLQEVQQSELFDRSIPKERKMDLMHVGLCAVLEPAGYYIRRATDSEGWPHWDLVQPLPHMDIVQQGRLLRYGLVRYFGEWIAAAHQESLKS